MTNNEIVIQVYKTYDIGKLIKLLISESIIDQTYQDLEQYVYCELLQMDNTRLNALYNTGLDVEIDSDENKLRCYISNLIKNQRNLSRSHFNTKIKNRKEFNGEKVFYYNLAEMSDDIIKELIYEVDDNEIDDDFEEKLKFVQNHFSSYQIDRTGNTYEERRCAAENFFILESINTGLSVKEIAEKYSKSRSTVNTLIQTGKKRIIDNYEKRNERE